MYSFAIDCECECGADLTFRGSVCIADGSRSATASVDEFGMVVGADGSEVILSDPEPVVWCQQCQGLLEVDAFPD